VKFPNSNFPKSYLNSNAGGAVYDKGKLTKEGSDDNSSEDGIEIVVSRKETHSSVEPVLVCCSRESSSIEPVGPEERNKSPSVEPVKVSNFAWERVVTGIMAKGQN
jgi:hypothetical protein